MAIPSAIECERGRGREVDLEDGTITLKHGRIAEMRMAPMSSMVFKTSDTDLLANLKPGDKVTFRAAMVGPQPTAAQFASAEK